jgi:AraC-like DNA-binding protein
LFSFIHNRKEQLLIRQANDCRMITSLIGNMVEEFEHKHPYYQENLQHYITLLLNIVVRNVSAVSYSDLTIGQIADELGFTDESDLSRLFKKYYGLTRLRTGKRAGKMSWEKIFIEIFRYLENSITFVLWI